MSHDDFYLKADQYWKSVPGGYERLTEVDARDSLQFIGKEIRRTSIACGRVSKSFLLKVFDTVDLVEQNGDFLKESENYLKGFNVGERIPKGLQDFEPEKAKYDLIWCQWVLSHLTDDDLVSFLKRCIEGITPGGAIGIKENTSLRGNMPDPEDSSVTRTDAGFKRLFKRAGLVLVKEAKQTDFPPELFPVKMYLLKPMSSVEKLNKDR